MNGEDGPEEGTVVVEVEGAGLERRLEGLGIVLAYKM